MKKAKKILTLVACAVLLVALSVGATIAYLTASDTVENTFTVGNIQMKMDETDVDNSTAGDNDRDKINEYPKIQPNDTLDKDPIVWLKKDAMAILRSYGIAPTPDSGGIAPGMPYLPGFEKMFLKSVG